jgi:hypothetical protein
MDDGNLAKAKELQIFFKSAFKVHEEIDIFPTQSVVNAAKSFH